MPRSALALIDKALARLYPPQPEELPAALDLLGCVSDVICNSASSRVVDLLDAFRTSTCVWVEDVELILLDAEYNNSVSRMIF